MRKVKNHDKEILDAQHGHGNDRSGGHAKRERKIFDNIKLHTRANIKKLIYIYIYIYVSVCVCRLVHKVNHKVEILQKFYAAKMLK